MNLVRENGKLRVYEAHGYTIQIWDKGSITISNGDDFIKVDHNAKNMKMVTKFFADMDKAQIEGDGGSRSYFLTFNKVASEILTSIKSYMVKTIDDKIVLDTRVPDQNMNRNSTGTLYMGVPKKDSGVQFKRNTRYAVSEVDGPFVYLEELEPISIRNIFQQYSQPILNVY